MYTLGIDIGSSSSKAVLLKNGSKIIAEDAIQAGTGRFLDVMSRVLETELSEICSYARVNLGYPVYYLKMKYLKFSKKMLLPLLPTIWLRNPDSSAMTFPRAAAPSSAWLHGGSS